MTRPQHPDLHILPDHVPRTASICGTQALYAGLRRMALVPAALLGALVVASPAVAAPVATASVESLEDRTLVGAIEAHELSDEAVELLERQADLDVLAARIQELADVDMRDGSGLSGLVVVPERNELRVYWHGAVSRPVEQHITKARHEGTTVSVLPAPYTRNELLAEVERIAALPLFQGERSGRRTMTAAPAFDGTSIDVQLGGFPESTTAARARESVPALDSPYPLSISFNQELMLAYRWIDFAQYAGGALITRGATSCSSVASRK